MTLIAAGTYRASNLANQTHLQVEVRMPRRDGPYSPARPTLVRAGGDGFDPAAVHILAGQSIVLLADTPARFLVEPAPGSVLAGQRRSSRIITRGNPPATEVVPAALVKPESSKSLRVPT